MNAGKGDIRIGTSGWYYKHWIGRFYPEKLRKDKVYVRFHGTNGRYQGNYPDPMLRDWADWIKGQLGAVRAVYAYFNNDISGHALNNARTLRRILGLGE